jgi:hypothetical protein
MFLACEEASKRSCRELQTFTTEIHDLRDNCIGLFPIMSATGTGSDVITKTLAETREAVLV